MPKSSGSSYPSPTQAWVTVTILSLTYMFSFIDRQILVLLIEPIKADLQITDTQVSLLTGLAFASVYTLAGIPMGRAADNRVRKYVIMFGVTVWSLLTIACGFVRNFPQLFLARMGVGLGEAALTPTAYAMMPDLFPPEKLAKGMSIFALGSSVGAGMSLLFGGFVIGLVTDIGTLSLPLVGEIRTWQLVLIVVGAVSLLMILPLSLMQEPKRQGIGKLAKTDDTPSVSTDNPTTESIPFKSILAYLKNHRTFYGSFFAGIALYALFIYGIMAWLPSYFIRVHHWEAADAGITLGALTILPSIVGTLSAGWLSDYFYSKGYRGAPLYMAITALLLSIPLLLGVIYIPLMAAKLVAMVVLFFTLTVLGVIPPTVTQMATPARIRGQVSAIYLLIVNLVGIGFGPTAIALVTDNVFQDEVAVGHSIAVIGVLACGFGAAILCFAVKPFKQQIQWVTAGEQNESNVGKTVGKANTPLSSDDASLTTVTIQ